MHCKVICLQDEALTSKMLSQLDFNNYKIVTDDLNVKNSLKNLNFDCEELSELFPNVSPITFQIYDSATKLIDQYKKYLEKIQFLKISIFNIIEPLIRDDFVLYQQVLHILKKKENVIFLLKNTSHILFLIKSLSEKFGYEFVQKNQIELIKNGQIQKIFDFDESKSIKKKLFLKFFHKSKSSIMESVENKFNKKGIHQNSTMIFFTPSTYYVLKPIFSVVKEFEEQSTPYYLISFDHNLVKELNQKNIETLDFSRDALLLSSFIQNSSEGKKIFNDILTISKQNNLDILFYNNFYNQKLLKLFRFLATLEISSYILQKLYPKSTIVAFDGNSMGNSISLASKLQNIPSYSICSLYVLPHSIMKLNFTTDFICIYGTHGRDILKKLGYDPEKIIITGNVNYDYLDAIDLQNCRDIIENSFNLIPDRPLIVIGSGRWHPNDFTWIPKFIKFCNAHKINLIIKVHPIYLSSLNHIHQDMLKKIQKDCHDCKYIIDANVLPSNLLPVADLVITDQTNLGIEAALLGKPWVTINFENEDEDFLFKTSEHLHNSIHLTNYDELETTINDILFNNKFSNLIESHKQEIIKKFNYSNNRTAANTIFSIINE